MAQERLPAPSTVSPTDVAGASIRLSSGSGQSARKRRRGFLKKGPVSGGGFEDARSGAARRAETGLTRRRRQPPALERVKAQPERQRGQSVALPDGRRQRLRTVSGAGRRYRFASSVQSRAPLGQAQRGRLQVELKGPQRGFLMAAKLPDELQTVVVPTPARR
jgi:hypothetical protein